ncbi:MAG TPA: type 4a pilus biogenesis protein PilO [Cellvibrionaceae bacterium]|nr:type 4a pilus biogenesis protein PilO [Cellvibrionaceae bacterium]
MADLREYLEQLKSIEPSEINWERVGVWPWPARAFLALFAGGAIVAAAYFLVVKDKQLQLEDETRKEVSLKETFQKKAFEASNLEKYRQQIAEMEESFEALKKQLPNDTEVPGLLEDIDEKGVGSRLVIDSITLQPEKPAEFYVELPIDIKVTGGYHEFGSFVSGIAGMPRIVTLHNFSISRKKDSSSALVMEIQAKTYRYRNQGE